MLVSRAVKKSVANRSESTRKERNKATHVLRGFGGPLRWQQRTAWTATKLCTPLRDPIPLRCAVSPSLRASVLARSTVRLPNNSRCPSRRWRGLSPEVRDEEPQALRSPAGNALKLDHTWQFCPAKVLLHRHFRELMPFPKHLFPPSPRPPPGGSECTFTPKISNHTRHRAQDMFDVHRGPRPYTRRCS